ncbi:MAG TPA: glyoxalase [Dehalococcoidia bacterium]|nr:glyoxalase [Dehalococcoidia bacterium]
MKSYGNMKILFVAGFGPVVNHFDETRKLYRNVFGIPFKEYENGYMFTEEGVLEGVKHFALWPLAHAAQNCFGEDTWPTDLPVPQAWIEFDVENVYEAANELKSQGYRLLFEPREEPWGQTVTRFLDPEGILVGITQTPWLRHNDERT